MKPTPISALLLVLCNALVFGGSLTYDRASGNLDGFAVNTSDYPSIPSQYAVSQEYWQNSGFIGRLVYEGEPTNVTISNIGPIPTNASNNRFYFTLNNTGTPNAGSWREFFLIARPKGLTHGGASIAYTAVNSVIANNNDTFLIPEGAGEETVEPGEIGYDTQAREGMYDGLNGYRYKYPYRYIWVDLTLIRTTVSRNIQKGYYESHFSLTTTTGMQYIFHLAGENNPRNYHIEPEAFYFGIEETYQKAFPYSLLQDRNTINDALQVAIIKYTSHIDQAQIAIASDAAGINTNFSFNSPQGLSFPFKVVFDATTPNLSPMELHAGSNSFTTSSTSETSPIGGSYTAYRLEGAVKLFVSPDTYPGEGTYSATIYVLITRID
ncbi:MAG: hypothetical protein AB7C91_09850 [Sphaerochaeta sp.]|uniref:hypothetical protein n=1 Tax=Sphaerochaeta sp. TaxID=1972642 RepID=UPI003D0FB887